MATTLIRAADGGTASDDGLLSLLVLPRALLTNTTITVVVESIASIAGRNVLRAWRIVADPAPALLSAPARLSVAIPPGTSQLGLVVLVAEDVTAPDVDWRALAVTARRDGWLDAQIWCLPPFDGLPPNRSSSVVCLCGPPPNAANAAPG